MSGVIHLLLHDTFTGIGPMTSHNHDHSHSKESIMSGLILVSHNQSQRTTLSAIYESILSRCGGLWISWNGVTETQASDALRALTFRQSGQYDTLSFALTPGEVMEGYHDYIHKGLWPVFYQRPDLAQFSASGRREYQNINETYARAICEYAMPDDIIWIQDYHLLACARYVREAGLTNPVGFFLHQPFPSGKVFEAVPEWRWLAESMLCYDLIGFQTVQDMNNFVVWLESEFRIEHTGVNTYRIQGRIVRIGVFPVGIDFEDVRCLLDSNSCEFMEQQCLSDLPGNTVLSVGHLDDSAGLPYRISALEVLLRTHPSYHHNITLLQLASPAAGHAHQSEEISQRLESQCGEFNGIHGTLDWYPVSCMTRSYSREEQAGIYRASRVALVTPLSSGMSLMAKMYVALQDPDNPGVLVLSKFAGAAEQMDGAIIVNPYDPQTIANALHTALSLSLRERRNMHSRLMKGLHLNGCHAWAERFLSGLDNTDVKMECVQSEVAKSLLYSCRARY